MGRDFSQVYACGYRFQTGVCMWVEISDRCMHVGTDFRQVYACGYRFQTGVCMWVIFRHVYSGG